jgi:hypothetical protein
VKLRSDFVTNSSSSAFVVIWPCKINDESDVSKYICNDSFWPIIFRDCEAKKGLPVNSPKAMKKIINELCSGHIDGIMDHYQYEEVFCKREGIDRESLWDNRGWQDQCYEEVEIKHKEHATKKAKEFIAGKEGYVYFFEYGDEDGGVYSKLEHENDWGGLPHIKISHH